MFVHNGVNYTPLSSTDEYDEYVITANGSYIIYVGNQVYMSFSVNGITPPSSMTGIVAARQLTAVSGGEEANEEQTSSYCLNYPLRATSAYPYFGLQMYVEEGFELDIDDFDVHNAEIDGFGYDSTNGFVYLYVHPINADEVCYVLFEDFIFFVGNYGG
mgnify:FL=1